MIDPMIDILLFLSAAFVLGVALGWALWKLGAEEQMSSAMTESEFWQQRMTQARAQNDLQKERIEALEKERETLKERLKAS